MLDCLTIDDGEQPATTGSPKKQRLYWINGPDMLQLAQYAMARTISLGGCRAILLTESRLLGTCGGGPARIAIFGSVADLLRRSEATTWLTLAATVESTAAATGGHGIRIFTGIVTLAV
jgi:hypothetical protein